MTLEEIRTIVRGHNDLIEHLQSIDMEVPAKNMFDFMAMFHKFSNQAWAILPLIKELGYSAKIDCQSGIILTDI